METQVGSVAVPVPPAAQEDCSASVAKPCTAANTASLNAAVAAGTPMLTTAITKLGGPDAATKDLVRRLFLGGDPAATDAQVVAKATAVQAKLVDWRTHLGSVMGAANHRCVKSCDPICDNADAYNQGTGGAALKSFCATYFAKTPAEQAVTMVHECGHGTPSVSSKDIAYGPMRRLDTLTEAEAMKNTDSYVVLVRNLVAPGSAQIGGSDTFAGGMTNPEESMAQARPELDRDVAQLLRPARVRGVHGGIRGGQGAGRVGGSRHRAMGPANDEPRFAHIPRASTSR